MVAGRKAGKTTTTTKKTTTKTTARTRNDDKNKNNFNNNKTLVRGVASFSNADRVNFVTGFRKRKNERRKKAAGEFERKLKEERSASKMRKRQMFREALGLQKEEEEEENNDKEKTFPTEKQETTYASGVHVVVEGV